MKGSEFVFNYVHLLYYKSHKQTNPNHSGSYIDFPGWTKIKNATINAINKKDNKCFQYAVTVSLNYEEIEKDPQRIAKTNKYTWEGINFPLETNDWKKEGKIM